VIRSEEVYAAKSPLSRESPVDPETATPCDTSVLDIVLVLGHVGIITYDAICGLLAECLQDVSSAVFVMPYLFSCYWIFNFFLFLY
jgi:hypothetical protein